MRHFCRLMFTFMGMNLGPGPREFMHSCSSHRMKGSLFAVTLVTIQLIETFAYL